MYTKSILYALTGILLPALLAAIPAGAQVNFASQNTGSFSGRNLLSVTGPTGYYTSARSDRQFNTGSMFALSLLTARENGITEETPTANSSKKNTDLPAGKLNVGTGKITFRRTSFAYPVGLGKDVGIAGYSADQLTPYMILLKQYAKKNGFDTTYAFFSNMGVLNNKKRFFVVDLGTMEIVESGLVAQGRGQGSSRFDRQYSNEKDSRCTSLGRYSIIKKYRGEYGVAYRMAGLDSSNSNAYKRNIVLHSMGCMPDRDDNAPVCISEGCPAVSTNFLSSLSKIIDSRKRPLLLWVFDSNLEEAIIEKKAGDQGSGYFGTTIYHRCSIHQAEDNISID